MNLVPLRLRLLFIAAPAASGCGGPPATSTPEPVATTVTTPVATTVAVPVATTGPAPSAGLTSSAPRSTASAPAVPASSAQPRMVGNALCVRDLHPEVAYGDSEAFNLGCSTLLTSYVGAPVQGPRYECGNRSWHLSAADTRGARQQDPGVCCYVEHCIGLMLGRPLVVEARPRHASLRRGLAGWSA